ncbi:H-type lectin domain-containing protein [Nannocystaceae bacterium ST9]
MAITTKPRKDLKSYFVKNAIPTEGNFAEMIDAGLNQADDGVFKLSGEPLSVVAAGGDQKRTLRLYAAYPSANPDWLISLNPAQDPANPATNRPGFGVADGAGNTRLFIDSATGKLGVGTNNPADRLHVRDGDVLIEGGRYRRLKIISDKFWAGIELVTREAGEAGSPHIDFTHGQLDAPDFGTRLWGPNNTTLTLEAGTGNGNANFDVRGSVSYTTTLSKLDVAEQGAATIRASDLLLGHSGRRGTPGRALVDNGSSLVFNWASDWPRADVHGPLTAGKLTIGATDTTYPLDVRVPGATGNWDRFVVTANTAWGNGNTHVTIGAGGASGIMFNNPHVSWMSGESRASIRYGVTGGVAGGTFWDAGVRADGAFTLIANDGGGVGETLRINKTGSVSVRTDFDIEGTAGLGFARAASDYNAPLRSGFYQQDNPVGRVPDNTHSWVHMISVRHNNTGNQHQLQIASSYAENDKLYFRKIARSIGEVARPAWNEIATVAAMPKIRSGMANTAIPNGNGARTATINVVFGYTYASPPAVQAVLSGLDTAREYNVRLTVTVDTITTTGCRLVFTTWADSIVWGAWATWIAVGV